MLLDIKNAPQWIFLKPITSGIADNVDKLFLNANYNTHFAFLESQLATSPDGGKYLCGKTLTAADILMSFPLIAGKGKIDRVKFPKLAAYSDLLESDEGYVASTKRIEELSGEPFQVKL